jgi:hypothetical protein
MRNGWRRKHSEKCFLLSREEGTEDASSRNGRSGCEEGMREEAFDGMLPREMAWSGREERTEEEAFLQMLPRKLAGHE